MTFAFQRRRSLALLAIVALWTSALAGFGPWPARASYYEWGVSFSTDIVRNDVTYGLNVKALHGMGGPWLQATISLRHDPEGPTVLRQAQTWTYRLSEEAFVQDGDAYRIDVGDEAGPFRVNLIVERRQDERCSETQPLFVSQPEGGGLRIETGNEIFGTLNEQPECATTWSFSSGPRPGPPPCPLPGQELESSLNVKERRGAEALRIRIHEERQRTVPGGRAQWSVLVRGKLPAADLRLDRDLEGSLSPQGAPWLEGKARFDPQGPPERSGWYDCRGGREARGLGAEGAIVGDLTVDVIGYESYVVNEPTTWAVRSRVRPRR